MSVHIGVCARRRRRRCAVSHAGRLLRGCSARLQRLRALKARAAPPYSNAAGLPAVGLPAFGSWDTDGDAIVHDGLRAVAEAQRAGLLPVLHGDSVLDARQGCRILSGDTIMRRLVEAPSLGPATVVFLVRHAA